MFVILFWFVEDKQLQTNSWNLSESSDFFKRYCIYSLTSTDSRQNMVVHKTRSLSKNKCFNWLNWCLEGKYLTGRLTCIIQQKQMKRNRKSYLYYLSLYWFAWLESPAKIESLKQLDPIVNLVFMNETLIGMESRWVVLKIYRHFSDYRQLDLCWVDLSRRSRTCGDLTSWTGLWWTGGGGESSPGRNSVTALTAATWLVTDKRSRPNQIGWKEKKRM